MLSFSHLILLFLVVLLVFGPKKLPEVARTLSKAMAEFHRLSGDFQDTLQREMRQLEREALEDSRPKPAPPLVEPAAGATDSATPAPSELATSELASDDAVVSGDAGEQRAVAAGESHNGDAPHGDVPDEAGAPSAAAPSSEALPYYDALYDTAVASGVEWPPEASEAADAGSPHSALAAEKLAGEDSPQIKNPAADETVPAEPGTETPINDHHPTAA